MKSLPALSQQEKSTISISGLTASGEIEKLKQSLHRGLDNGLSINYIKEILIQLYAYVGFPRSLNAIGALMTVLEERRQNGMQDAQGEEPLTLPADKSRFTYGDEMQQKLIGAPAKGPALEFVPAIDTFLKEHLFADIFCRGILTLAQRELVTVSALASLGGVAAQLGSHIKIAMNVGVTPEQLQELADLLGQKVSEQAADNVRNIFNG